MARIVIAVRDKETHAPIPFVAIEVNGYRTFTGVDGMAYLDVPEGTYRLIVRSLAYRPVTLTVRAPSTVRVELERAHF